MTSQLYTHGSNLVQLRNSHICKMCFSHRRATWPSTTTWQRERVQKAEALSRWTLQLQSLWTRCHFVCVFVPIFTPSPPASFSFLVLVLTPDPTCAERVWWCLTNPSGFINVDCFLCRIFQPPITLQKTDSVVATPESLGYFSTMTQHSLARKLVISCVQ